MVEGARPSRRAIERIDSPCEVPIMICSRSSWVRRGRLRPNGSCSRGFTPPNLRNHLPPAVTDTPAARAASSVDIPSAVNSQNRRSTDNNCGTPVTNTPNYEVLQPPLELKRVPATLTADSSRELTERQCRRDGDRPHQHRQPGIAQHGDELL